MRDRAMREITHMRATIAAMREPVFACYRSAMMGEALRCRTRVSDVTGVRDMSGAPRVDRASMRAADVTGMHPATVTDMHPATVSDMRAAAVSDMRAAAVPGKTAEMRRPAGMHTTAPKVGRTTATKMRCRAAKVGAATTEMRYPAAAKVRATTTAKVRATAATTTEMRRSHRERKGGNAESQSGRQSSNNPTRHSTTPTI